MWTIVYHELNNLFPFPFSLPSREFLFSSFGSCCFFPPHSVLLSAPFSMLWWKLLCSAFPGFLAAILLTYLHASCGSRATTTLVFFFTTVPLCSCPDTSSCRPCKFHKAYLYSPSYSLLYFILVKHSSSLHLNIRVYN